MKIFQPTITGSFIVTGSATVTGSLIVSSGITGSLFGTSSFATTSSYALTSSLATTASFALNAGTTVSTASLLVTASATSNILTFTKGDASTFTVTVATGSGGGSGAGFPYSGSAVITGSLLISGSGFIVTGSTGLLGSSVILASNLVATATSQSYFLLTGSIQQVQTASAQIYGVNITPTMIFTTGSQTNTVLRVAPTFSGSAALTSSQQNIIADFGATSVGTQFSVNDITSGSIYMVNDVSGLPIIEALSDWTVNMYNYPTKVFQKTGSNIIISGSQIITGSSTLIGNQIITGSLNVTGSGTITGTLAIGTGSAGSGESNLVLGPAPAGGTGEGGQIALLGTGGSYTSSSFIDTYQNQFRLLSGQGTTSATGILAVDLGTKNANFQGAVTASGFSGLPNDYLYVNRNTDQTVVTNWISTDIIFNNSVVSKGISYNTGTGLATLTGGKVYRITARLAWSAAAAYLLEYSCYTSANTQIGPTTQIVQSTNGSNNISDGTLDFIYAPGSNTDIKIRTTANTTALSGEKIRGDLNTQLIIQQIA